MLFLFQRAYGKTVLKHPGSSHDSYVNRNVIYNDYHPVKDQTASHISFLVMSTMVLGLDKAANIPTNIFLLRGVGLPAVRGGMGEAKVTTYLQPAAIQQATGTN